MAVTEYTSDEEKEVVMAMLTNATVLAAIAPHWKSDIFGDATHFQLLGDWATKHFLKYNTAPQSETVAYFRRWAAKHKVGATIEMVEKILTQLNGRWKKYGNRINPDRVIELAEDTFRRIQLLALANQLQKQAGKDPGEAISIASKFAPLFFRDSNTIDSAQSAVEVILERPPEVLIKYSGALGTFFANQLYRTATVSFGGESKIGKTWFLIEMARKALDQGRKVHYYTLGDLTSSEVLDRLGCALSGKYSKLSDDRQTKLSGVRSLSIPNDVSVINPDSAWTTHPPEVDVSRKQRKRRAFADLSKAQLKKFWEPYFDSGLVVRAAPTGSKSIEAIRSELIVSPVQPDVLILDYADILYMPTGSGGDTRSGHNEIWKGLRRISQEFNLLLITATQTKKASIGKPTLLGASDYSEDGRKNDHVTAMIGINQTPDLKNNGVYALNYMLARSIPFDASQPVYCAGNLDIARPCITSRFF